jgi:hypothetical protein
MGVAARLQALASGRHFKVIRAGDKETAWSLLQTQPLAVAIIDVGRESGDSQALLRSIGRGYPALPLFVFNGFMIPGLAEKAKEYDHVRYCEDSGELLRFISLILEEIATKKRAMIKDILLTNFLDWLNTVKLSGQVIVSCGAKQGVLFLQEGRLIGAEMGAHEQRVALAEMSTWEKVTVEIKEGGPPRDRASRPEAGAPAAGQRPLPGRTANQTREGGTGGIETLRLVQKDQILQIRIKALQLAVAGMRELLSDSLLRLDIFLSAGGRSLAGWNSQPLACSAFAGVTCSLIASLAASRFPPLGDYYLIDLADDRQVLVVFSNELQMGMLLVKSKLHLGLLTHIVLPQAMKSLNESYTLESLRQEVPWE